MGVSSSKSSSTQTAEAYLAQQFSGSCNVTCTNITDDTNIDIINTIVSGDINLTQKCAVDASCSISSTSDATSDIMFKAANSTNAKNAGGIFPNIDSAVSDSRQIIKQSIIENTTEKCDMSSLNQMNNVNILAVNSKIGGSINIDQTGNATGSCQLKNNMTAATTATAMATNSAKSGKDKKGGKKSTIAQLIGFLAVLTMVYFIASAYTRARDTGKMTKAMKAVALARVEAGCPGGKKPIVNHKTGMPIIDPKTLGPICPPVDPSTASPVVNIDLGSMINKLEKKK